MLGDDLLEGRAARTAPPGQGSSGKRKAGVSVLAPVLPPASEAAFPLRPGWRRSSAALAQQWQGSVTPLQRQMRTHSAGRDSPGSCLLRRWQADRGT